MFVGFHDSVINIIDHVFPCDLSCFSQLIYCSSMASLPVNIFDPCFFLRDLLEIMNGVSISKFCITA